MMITMTELVGMPLAIPFAPMGRSNRPTREKMDLPLEAIHLPLKASPIGTDKNQIENQILYP